MDSAPIKTPKVSPKLKKELKKKVPTYISQVLENFEDGLDALEDSGDPATFKYKSPDQFMKHMDTSMESFFYQREYNTKNFNFYFQVLAAQYKKDEAIQAFRKMEAMGIKPNDSTYNYLMLNYAKNKDIENVIKLN